MNKQLESTFNIKNTKEDIKEIKNEFAATKSQSIVSVDDLNDHDAKMDEYGNEAFKYAKEIYETAMGSEAKHAAEMFNAASTFIKVAMDAKNNKLEKRLKLYDLELKKQKMDEAKKPQSGGYEMESGVVMANREDLFGDD